MDTVLNIVLLSVFWCLSVADTWFSLKVTKTVYIRELNPIFRFFIVAPFWAWVVTGVVALITSGAFLYAADTYGLFGYILLGAVIAAKGFACYRGLLVYTREHNLKYVQARKKEQGVPVTTTDKIKDLAVRVTPQRR